MWKLCLTVLWLGALAVVDLWRKKVPVWCLVAGGIAAVLAGAYAYSNGTKDGVEILWGLLPGCLLLFVAAATGKAGWADGIVLMTLGLITDFRQCAVSFVISLFAISIVSLLLLAIRKVGKNAKLPYLPFLWAGYLLQTIGTRL